MNPPPSSFRSIVEDIVHRIDDVRAGLGRSSDDDDSSEERSAPRPHLPAAASEALTKELDRWVRARRPSLPRILRGAAAGAGAAGLLAVYHLLRRRNAGEDLTDLRSDLLDEVLAGAGRGVLYAAVLDPILPGPAVVRGATAGLLDYLLAPWGGVFSRLQGLSPAARIPVVNVLLEMGDAEDDPLLAFLLFGIALGLLTGEAESPPAAPRG